MGGKVWLMGIKGNSEERFELGMLVWFRTGFFLIWWGCQNGIGVGSGGADRMALFQPFSIAIQKLNLHSKIGINNH